MIPIRMRRIGTIAVLGVVIALIGVGLIGIASQTGSQSVAAAGANSWEGSVAGVSSWTVPGDAGQDHTSGGEPSGPAVGGRGVILLNSRDGRILFERGADKPLPMASTTKIMTAVLVLENLPMDRKVSVSEHAASVGESELWLEPGEVMSVQDLLYGLLVKSANDAAAALAEEVAGDVDSFVQMMNEKAEELGLANTHFMNPHGLDSGRYETDEHYTSARDLAQLARYAMEDAEFRRLVSTLEIVIPWPGREYSRLLANRNDLLGKLPYITGVKTGYTTKAGYCLVGAGSREGISLVSVVLGAESKDEVDADTIDLLDWGFSRYSEMELLREGEAVVEIPVPYSSGEKMPLVAKRQLVRTLLQGQEITKEVLVVDQPELPLEVGDMLGKVRFKADGELVAEVNLISERAVEVPTLLDKLRFWWDRLLHWVGSGGSDGDIQLGRTSRPVVAVGMVGA